jgi:hypothetical protein
MRVVLADGVSGGGIKPKSLRWVNILEEPMDEEGPVVWRLEGETTIVELDFRGFEVRTILVEV